MGCVVHPDSEVMGTCQQTLEGGSPVRTGLLFTSACIFPLSQSRGKGKVLLAVFHQLLHLHPDLQEAGGQISMFEMASSVLAVSAVYGGMPSQEEL